MSLGLKRGSSLITAARNAQEREPCPELDATLLDVWNKFSRPTLPGGILDWLSAGRSVLQLQTPTVGVDLYNHISSALFRQGLVWSLGGLNPLWDLKAPILNDAWFDDELLDHITISRRSTLVDEFLEEHEFLRQIVLEACQRINKYFDPIPQLVLDVSTDPEDGSRELLLLIQTDKAAAEALPMLDRFDEEWWFDNADRGQGLLIIKLEYV